MPRKKPRRVAAKHKLPIEHTGFYGYLQPFLEHRMIIGRCQHNDKRLDSSLRQFMVWCEARGINMPQEVTRPMIERYQKHLFYRRKDNGQPLSFSAQRKYLNNVMHFFSWLAKQNYILYNPASDIELPRQPKRLPRAILTVEVVLNLIESINTSTPEGIRDRAMFETLYSTAIRRYELVSLKLQDIDLKRNSLFVFEGKWGKDRLLPLGVRAARWVQYYLDEARPNLIGAVDEHDLFINDYGEAYTASGCGHLIKRHLTKHGIHHGGAHLFRHACATHMLENGADIRFIQTLLGHGELSTTEIYTRVTIEKLREIHTATHPAKLSAEDHDAITDLFAHLDAEADDET